VDAKFIYPNPTLKLSQVSHSQFLIAEKEDSKKLRIRKIREAQKQADPTDPAPQHWQIGRIYPPTTKLMRACGFRPVHEASVPLPVM
jgi:hypothetical protein